MKKYLQQPLLLIAALAALFVLILIATVATVISYQHFTQIENKRGQFIIQLSQVDGSQLIPKNGIVIREVSPESPAAKADLKAGDIILAVDGDDIIGSSALIEAIDKHQAGDSITLSVQSGDLVRDVTLELASAGPYLGVETVESENTMNGTASLHGDMSDIPAPFDDLIDFLPLHGESPESPPKLTDDKPQPAVLPVSPEEVAQPKSQNDDGKGYQGNPDLLQDQIMVWSVEPGSPADQAGLQAGDIITKIAGKNVSRTDDFVENISSLSPKVILTLEIIRGKTLLKMSVTLGNHPNEESRPYLGIFLAPERNSRQQFFDQGNQND